MKFLLAKYLQFYIFKKFNINFMKNIFLIVLLTLNRDFSYKYLKK